MHLSKKAKNLIAYHQTPLLLLSPKDITTAYKNLKNALPNVALYYALKANNHPKIIETLTNEGANFDVCSNAEIDLVKNIKKDTTKWIHTHPIKSKKTIDYAYKNGLRTFVVDNILELNKLTNYRYDTCILVRMAIEKTSAKIDFSKKFGTIGFSETISLIQKVKEKGFKKIGISFHCGSQAVQPDIFINALVKCKQLIYDLSKSDIKLSILDIGGGFPNHPFLSDFDISAYCKKFIGHIQDIADEGIELIAEPGRIISGDSMTLVTKIIGKSMRSNKMWYYIDESVYNSFSGMIYDEMDYPLSFPEEYNLSPKLDSVIAGQTCDSIDIIKQNILLPDLPLGTILKFEKMGAYTSVSASTFNGFQKTKIVSID